MNYIFRVFLFTTCLAMAGALWSQHSGARAAEERLTFQTHRPWSPRINLNADVAMNYGIDPSLPSRMETWRQHGYRTEVMTGVAWGQYQDYLDGKYDGRSHWDEAQTARDGSKILHGGSKDVPYISPGQDYGRYLTVGVKRALDAGAQAIYLEEPGSGRAVDTQKASSVSGRRTITSRGRRPIVPSMLSIAHRN
jgi:hypothetical protein